MTDLENDIRSALAQRADAIRDDHLRGTGNARPRHRSVWPALAAAAVVAVLTIGGALLLARGGSHTGTSAGGHASAAPVQGFSWRLVSVTSKSGTVAAPPAPRGNHGPFIDFPGNDVDAYDSVTFASGTFRATADGFRMHNAAGTGAGYAGHDPRVLAAQAAFGAVISGADVTARVRGATLVLSVHGYTLRLVNQGRAVIASSASATPTR